MRNHYRYLAGVCLVGFWVAIVSSAAEPSEGIVLDSPNNTVTEARPTFTWDDVDGASWYQVWLHRDGAYHWQEWTSEETWTPSWDMTDYPGSYEWWVRSWGSDGYEPWSSSLTFAIGPTKLSSPSGTVAEGKPTFSWEGVSGASWYRIWLHRNGAYHYREWTQEETWTPSWNMTDYPGNYEWWVQIWGPDGYGPWSSPLTFAIGATTPRTPSEVVATGDVSFTWDVVETATWYHFWLDKDGVAYADTWLEGNVERTLTLPPGGYEYWVRTWGSGDYGPWSDSLSFTVSDLAVRGTVTGDIREGVTVKLSGDASATTTTDADGSYSFPVVDGTYTITPSLDDYVFTSAKETVDVVSARHNVDFTSSLLVAVCPEGGDPSAEEWAEIVNTRWVRNNYAKGKVTMSDRDTGLMWVYDADANRTANWGDAVDKCANLVYAEHDDWFLPNMDQLADMYQKKGSFADVRSDLYWSSTPHNRSYAYLVKMDSGVVNISYVTGRRWMWPCRGGGGFISGKVIGDVQEDVVITLTGDAHTMVTTAADGSYSIEVPAGNYTITPSLGTLTFTSPSEAVTATGAPVTGVDFGSTIPPYSINGTVTGDVQEGVTVTLSGDASATTTTAEDGGYSFSVVDGVYTVTPALKGYAFADASYTVTIAGANMENVGFSSAALNYSISGTVTGDAQQGVTMTLSGDESETETTTTAIDGSYSFSVVYGTYTITPSLSGYIFSDVKESVTTSGADLENVDFKSAAP